MGRWTRPHSDIDLNAYVDSRERLSEELEAIGFRSADKGWLTHWSRDNRPWRLELVFLERTQDGSAVLVIPLDAPVGVPGHYPIMTGYLDPGRYATLDGVRFRVCSPSGEWLARTSARQSWPEGSRIPRSNTTACFWNVYSAQRRYVGCASLAASQQRSRRNSSLRRYGPEPFDLHGASAPQPEFQRVKWTVRW